MWASDTRAKSAADLPAMQGHGAVDVLTEIVEPVAGRAEIALDGGVRTSTDVAIALSLGAAAIAISRPVLWALAPAGKTGVKTYLHGLRDDLARALVMLGARSPRDLTPACVDTRFCR